jgi:hypothetical protein
MLLAQIIPPAPKIPETRRLQNPSPAQHPDKPPAFRGSGKPKSPGGSHRGESPNPEKFRGNRRRKQPAQENAAAKTQPGIESTGNSESGGGRGEDKTPNETDRQRGEDRGAGGRDLSKGLTSPGISVAAADPSSRPG